MEFHKLPQSNWKSCFIPKKIPTWEFVYPKNFLLSLACPKKFQYFSKKSKILLSKDFSPKKILRTLPSLKYVSGPLDLHILQCTKLQPVWLFVECLAILFMPAWDGRITVILSYNINNTNNATTTVLSQGTFCYFF